MTNTVPWVGHHLFNIEQREHYIRIEPFNPGGGLCTNSPLKITLPYLWRYDAKPWNEAKTACEQESAKFFDNVDGSYELMKWP